MSFLPYRISGWRDPLFRERITFPSVVYGYRSDAWPADISRVCRPCVYRHGMHVSRSFTTRRAWDRNNYVTIINSGHRSCDFSSRLSPRERGKYFSFLHFFFQLPSMKFSRKHYERNFAESSIVKRRSCHGLQDSVVWHFEWWIPWLEIKFRRVDEIEAGIVELKYAKQIREIVASS